MGNGEISEDRENGEMGKGNGRNMEMWKQRNGEIEEIKKRRNGKLEKREKISRLGKMV